MVSGSGFAGSGDSVTPLLYWREDLSHPLLSSKNTNSDL